MSVATRAGGGRSREGGRERRGGDGGAAAEQAQAQGGQPAQDRGAEADLPPAGGGRGLGRHRAGPQAPRLPQGALTEPLPATAPETRMALHLGSLQYPCMSPVRSIPTARAEERFKSLTLVVLIPVAASHLSILQGTHHPCLQSTAVIRGREQRDISQIFCCLLRRPTGIQCQCRGIGVRSGSTCKGREASKSRPSSCPTSSRPPALARCGKHTRKRSV